MELLPLIIVHLLHFKQPQVQNYLSQDGTRVIIFSIYLTRRDNERIMFSINLIVEHMIPLMLERSSELKSSFCHQDCILTVRERFTNPFIWIQISMHIPPSTHSYILSSDLRMSMRGWPLIPNSLGRRFKI